MTQLLGKVGGTMNLKAVWVGGQDWIKNKQQQQNIGAGDKGQWV